MQQIEESRRIKEAIEIRKRAEDTMNRDEGAFMLSHTWDAVLQTSSDNGGRLQLRTADKDTSATSDDASEEECGVQSKHVKVKKMTSSSFVSD